MKIYISIPIKGHSFEEQKAKAAEKAKEIKALGHEPVNPFDIVGGETADMTDAQYAAAIGKDIEALIGCSAIYMCRGWGQSRGCQLEYECALIYGLEVYDHTGDLGKQIEISQRKKK